MSENRVNSIKKLFEGVGFDKAKLYTNPEIIDLLSEIQKIATNGVYEKTHAEHMRDRDLKIHFSRLAEEYGVKDTDTYKRFEYNINDLGYTIGTFVKGLQGERIAKRAMKLLSYDRNVKILYNIALEDEEVQAEYDAIAITPYGIFVIEVKNWNGEMVLEKNGILKLNERNIKYNLPGRMSVKEGLLRECLGDAFPDNYQSILLFPNENAEVQDEYHQIPICYGGDIVYMIRSFNKGKEILSVSQINNIVEKITCNHKEQRALCKVNCDEFIDDYAVLMAAIEDAAEGDFSSVNALKNSEEESYTHMNEENTESKVPIRKFPIERRNSKQLVIGLVAVLATFGLGIVTGKTIPSHK